MPGDNGWTLGPEIDFENITLGSETEILDYNYKFF